MDPVMTRRDFTEKIVGSLAVFSLLDALLATDAFGADLKSLLGRWLSDLDQLARDVKSQALKQVEWQKKVEELYSKVDLPDFLKLIEFDKLEKSAESYKGLGAKSLNVNFPVIEGVPTKFIFGRQIFAVKKGRSIVPHGHDSMATAFLVLKGQLRGRHYERLANEPKHMIITPTIDREFGPGGASSISDYKDNVHWFRALSDSAFVFNIHVLGVTPGSKYPTGRVYVDPDGEKLEGGKIRARVIDHDEADKLYG